MIISHKATHSIFVAVLILATASTFTLNAMKRLRTNDTGDTNPKKKPRIENQNKNQSQQSSYLDTLPQAQALCTFLIAKKISMIDYIAQSCTSSNQLLNAISCVCIKNNNVATSVEIVRMGLRRAVIFDRTRSVPTIRQLFQDALKNAKENVYAVLLPALQQL